MKSYLVLLRIAPWQWLGSVRGRVIDDAKMYVSFAVDLSLPSQNDGAITTSTTSTALLHPDCRTVGLKYLYATLTNLALRFSCRWEAPHRQIPRGR